MIINSPEKLLDRLTIENSNINTHKTALGFTNTDVTECGEDKANLQTMQDNLPIANADKMALTQLRDAVFNGDAKQGLNPIPVFDITTLPFPNAMAGALSRYKSRRTRGMASADYTEQIGEEMGYETASPATPQPDSVKPTLEAFPAAIGYLLSIVVGNRGQANLWEVQMKRKGETAWTTVKTASGKSVDITITPTTPGEPEQIELRIILYKNNALYGQPSDVVVVTVNP